MDDLFEEIMHEAINVKTSDIHILLKKDCHINFRVYGKIITYQVYDYEKGNMLMNYLRYKANIDINFRLRPQTGHFIYFYRNQKLYIRLSSLPGQHIDSIVIRILYQDQSLRLESLTPIGSVTTYLKQIIQHHSGLFLISGPTGSGKSTTLYTLLDEINRKEKRNIITIEDPIEVYKDYCLQIELNQKMGINYQDTLKQILRHDPDVIMIGEIRDQDTAKLAITCALTGHLVLTTIHASNAITTIKRMLNLHISSLDLEDVLIGVMSQRMIYSIQNQPIVLAEFLNRAMIKRYFHNQSISYITFEKQANELVKRKLLRKQDVGEL